MINCETSCQLYRTFIRVNAYGAADHNLCTGL